MDALVIVACTVLALLCYIIFMWHLCAKRFKNRGSPKERTLVIADFLQPHLICKSVPCQHPYYRVISEYNSKTYDRMPDIEEAIEESSPETEESPMQSDRHPKNFNYTEWYRRFSLTSLPRRCSWTSGSNRKSSSNCSIASSRRSSDSSTTSAPISPVYKTKPTLLTQVDAAF